MEGSRQDRKTVVTQLFGYTQAPFGEECLWNILYPGKGRCASLGGAPLQPDPSVEGSVFQHLRQPWPGPATTAGVSRWNPAQDAQRAQHSSCPLTGNVCVCPQSSAYMWLFMDRHVVRKHTSVCVRMCISCTVTLSGNIG